MVAIAGTSVDLALLQGKHGPLTNMAQFAEALYGKITLVNDIAHAYHDLSYVRFKEFVEITDRAKHHAEEMFHHMEQANELAANYNVRRPMLNDEQLLRASLFNALRELETLRRIIREELVPAQKHDKAGLHEVVSHESAGVIKADIAHTIVTASTRKKRAGHDFRLTGIAKDQLITQYADLFDPHNLSKFSWLGYADSLRTMNGQIQKALNDPHQLIEWIHAAKPDHDEKGAENRNRRHHDGAAFDAGVGSWDTSRSSTVVM